MKYSEYLQKKSVLEDAITHLESERAELVARFARESCGIKVGQLVEVRGHRGRVTQVRVGEESELFILEVDWLRRDGQPALGRGGFGRHGEVRYNQRTLPEWQQVRVVED